MYFLVQNTHTRLVFIININKLTKKFFLYIIIIKQKQAGVSLDEFVRKPSPFIEKTDRLAKLYTPKSYRLIIYPYLNETDDNRIQYTFEGVVWMVFAARRSNIRTIEINVKDLKINEDDVIVYKSFKIPNLKNLSQTYLDSTNYMNLSHSRIKRNIELIDDGGGALDINSTDSLIIPIDDTSQNPCIDDDDDNGKSNINEEEDDLDDDVLMKKINQVYFDEDDEHMIISLDVELRRNIFYTVKVNFMGNMTNDKGLFYRIFNEDSENPR